MTLNISGKPREAIFEIILDTVSDGVTVIDTDLRIRSQNKIVVQYVSG